MVVSPVSGSSYAVQAVQIGTSSIDFRLLEKPCTVHVWLVNDVGVKFRPKQCVSAWLSISIVDEKPISVSGFGWIFVLDTFLELVWTAEVRNFFLAAGFFSSSSGYEDLPKAAELLLSDDAADRVIAVGVVLIVELSSPPVAKLVGIVKVRVEILGSALLRLC
jgi:hypothetical protein